MPDTQTVQDQAVRNLASYLGQAALAGAGIAGGMHLYNRFASDPIDFHGTPQKVVKIPIPGAVDEEDDESVDTLRAPSFAPMPKAAEDAIAKYLPGFGEFIRKNLTFTPPAGVNPQTPGDIPLYNVAMMAGIPAAAYAGYRLAGAPFAKKQQIDDEDEVDAARNEYHAALAQAAASRGAGISGLRKAAEEGMVEIGKRLLWPLAQLGPLGGTATAAIALGAGGYAASKAYSDARSASLIRAAAERARKLKGDTPEEPYVQYVIAPPKLKTLPR